MKNASAARLPPGHFFCPKNILHNADKNNMSDKKKNTGLFVAVWFLILLLLLIVFFVKKDKITGNLQQTDFFGKVFGSTPEFVKNHKNTEDGNQEGAQTYSFDLLNPSADKKTSEPPVYQEATGSESAKAIKENADIVAPVDLYTSEDEPAGSGKPLSTAAEKNGRADEKNTAAEKKSGTEVASAVQLRDVVLYFMVINSDGTLSRKSVKRPLPKSDSPLTDSVNALLSGPLPEERSKNCMSLIPDGTRLLGASVKNGVATLNFSEQFEFNTLGVEGYRAQLTQLVFTATEFPTVKSVQFLIEGEKKDFLGSEGLWIGSPLARNSF